MAHSRKLKIRKAGFISGYPLKDKGNPGQMLQFNDLWEIYLYQVSS